MLLLNATTELDAPGLDRAGPDRALPDGDIMVISVMCCVVSP